MAHDDLDQLASSRFSADAITLASAHNNNKNHNVQAAHHPKASTPDSNLENKSFDSALHMSDMIPSGPSSISSMSSSSHHTVSTTAMVHTMPRNYTLKSHRSNSTGSLSDKSHTSSVGVEQGFNCDSPEGGTIKKKPSLNKNSGAKQNDEVTDGKANKPTKGVRFKESFTTGMPIFVIKLGINLIVLQQTN